MRPILLKANQTTQLSIIPCIFDRQQILIIYFYSPPPSSLNISQLRISILFIELRKENQIPLNPIQLLECLVLRLFPLPEDLRLL
jgi:hypothetical protein